MNRTRGFSLIEMLVVMTIMGLIVSVVTLSTGSLAAYFGGERGASAEAVADSLMTLMAAASAEAILSGEPVALGFAPSTAPAEDGVVVSWLRYGRVAGDSLRSRQPQWQSVSTQSGLQDLHLPAAITSELSIEGELLGSQALAGDSGVPALVFYPTGETTGFEWRLLQDGQTVILSNALTGNIERRQR